MPNEAIISATSPAAHAFVLGQRVRIQKSNLRTTDDIHASLYGSAFEITRLYPRTPEGFEYRIRNLATGQERMIIENRLERA